jgi:hypothetical protein
MAPTKSIVRHWQSLNWGNMPRKVRDARFKPIDIWWSLFKTKLI